MSTVAGFPMQAPAASSGPNVFATATDGSLNTPTDEGKTFDSFLETTQNVPNAGQEQEPQSAAQESDALTAQSANAQPGGLISGALGLACLIRACVTGKKLPQGSSTTSQNPSAAKGKSKTDAQPADGQQPDATGKTKDSKPDDGAASALASLCLPVTPSSQPQLSLSPDMTVPNPAQPAVPADKAAVFAPLNGDVAQASVDKAGNALPAFSQNAATAVVIDGDSRKQLPRGAVPEGSTSLETAAKPGDVTQVSPDKGAVPEESPSLKTAAKPVDVAQASADKGVVPDKSISMASAAKNAGTVESMKPQAGNTFSGVMQHAGDEDIANLSNSDGTSSAMQHGIMQDLKIQSPTKAGFPSVSADSAATSTVNPADAPAPALAEKNFGNPGHGQKNEDGRSGQPSQELGGLQMPHAGGGTISVSGPSFVAQTASTGQTRPAATILNQVMESAAKMRMDGQNNIDMQVRLRDGTEVSIKLQWSNGGIQATFKTASSELRQALEQNWPQFSSESTGRGVRMTTPVFESPDMRSGTNDLTQQQGRQQHPAEAWNGGAPVPLPRAKQFSTGNRAATAPEPELLAQASARLKIYA